MTRLALALYVLAGLAFNGALLALLWSLVGWVSLAIVAGAAALCVGSLLLLTRGKAHFVVSSSVAGRRGAASSQARHGSADRPPRRLPGRPDEPGMETPGRGAAMLSRSEAEEAAASRRSAPPQA